MKTNTKIFTALLTLACLGGCSTAGISPRETGQVRGAAMAFTTALREADADALRATAATQLNGENVKLADAVIGDAVAGRKMHVELQNRFNGDVKQSMAVGNERWLKTMETTAAAGPVAREGDLVSVGDGAMGTIYLRRVDGAWRVDVVPTLVAEAGGGTPVTDPAVAYRLEVAQAIDQWMLGRLKQGEFATYGDYERARNVFWVRYLTCVANGDEPRDKVLPTLPVIPKEQKETASER